MLAACRLAGLSALGAHYAGVKWRAMRPRTEKLLIASSAMADDLSPRMAAVSCDQGREPPGFSRSSLFASPLTLLKQRRNLKLSRPLQFAKVGE